MYIFSGRLPGCLVAKRIKRRNQNAFSNNAKFVTIINHISKAFHLVTLQKIKKILLHLKDDALITQSVFSSAGVRHLEIKQCEIFRQTRAMAAHVSMFVEDVDMLSSLCISPARAGSENLILDMFKVNYRAPRF